MPGKDGLCHVSKLDYKRVENVEDYVKVGDKLLVKVMEIDEKTGKISLSHKDTMPKPEGYEERPPRREGGQRNGQRRSDGRPPHRSSAPRPKAAEIKEAPAPAVKEEKKPEPVKDEKKEDKGGFFSKIFNK